MVLKAPEPSLPRQTAGVKSLPANLLGLRRSGPERPRSAHRPRSDDTRRAADCLGPGAALRANPSDKFKYLGVIARQVPLVDRLVMGDPVAQEVQALHTALHIGSNSAGITRAGVLRKRRNHGRHPQRGQVRLSTHEPPEPEVQLSDHLAVNLQMRVATGSPFSRCLYLLPSSISLLTRKKPTSAVPHIWPDLSGTMGYEGLINSIAEDDLEAPEIFVERSRNPSIPFVEPNCRMDVIIHRPQVGGKPASREPVSDDLIVER